MKPATSLLRLSPLLLVACGGADRASGPSEPAQRSSALVEAARPVSSGGGQPFSSSKSSTPAPTGSPESSPNAPASPPDPPSPEPVAFPTGDGGEVHGLLHGTGDHALLLVHGAIFTKESWDEQVPAFVAAGLRVLAIDLRGRGDSRGPGPEARGDTHEDVLAAVRFLAGRGARAISIVGGSLGGWSAARAAVLTEPGEIDRLVLLAAPPIEEPERLPGRKLFVVSRGDGAAAGRPRLPGIRDQFERAPDPKRLVILEGDAHAQHIFPTEHGPELLRVLVEFLTEE